MSDCTSGSDTQCDKCTPGQTYSDTSDQESCFPCSDCLTGVKTSCTVSQDTECRLDSECPLGRYRDASSEACLFCSEHTEGTDRVTDCEKEGIPIKFQFSYNPIDPRPYVVPTGSSSTQPLPSKSPQLASETDVAVIIAVSSSLAVVIMIMAAIVTLWYCMRRCRRHDIPPTPVLNTSSQPTTSGSEHATIGPDYLVKKLPKRTKDRLATQFMLRGRRHVFYVILADKFNFTTEEKNELELYCQEAKIRLFADKLFEFMEMKRPQPTVGQLRQVFVQEERNDLVQLLTECLYEVKLLLDMNADETSGQLIPNRQSSPVTSSGRIMINRSDSRPLLDDHESLSGNSDDCGSPIPGSPPHGSSSPSTEMAHLE